MAQVVQALAAIPGISQEQASVLVHNGLTTLEALLQVEVSDLAGIPEIGPENAAPILDAARAEQKRRSFNVGERPAEGSVAV